VFRTYGVLSQTRQRVVSCGKVIVIEHPIGDHHTNADHHDTQVLEDH
jgi:hypothetical protein